MRVALGQVGAKHRSVCRVLGQRPLQEKDRLREIAHLHMHMGDLHQADADVVFPAPSAAGAGQRIDQRIADPFRQRGAGAGKVVILVWAHQPVEVVDDTGGWNKRRCAEIELHALGLVEGDPGIRGGAGPYKQRGRRKGKDPCGGRGLLQWISAK